MKGLLPIYLSELIAKSPIVPFIRESDFAIRKPWNMPERRLLDYLLVYIQEGECFFRVDGTTFPLKSGDICLIQPNSLTYLEGRTNSITPFAHLDFFYNPERESSFPTRAGQTDLSGYSHLLQPRLNDQQGIDIPVRLKPKRPIVLRDKLFAMVESWQHRDTIMQLRAQTLATEILLDILEDHTDLTKAERAAPQPLNWITSFFSFNLSEPLTIQEMARRANLSPSRFSAKFKEEFGVPPHQYVLDLRIRHARELLKTTDIGIDEIAAYCGFADIHHFSKAFKKAVNTAPGAYRKISRNGSGPAQLPPT
ncbi:AraC family transcriptional regulator [Paenibacillus spongiae]|uniref:AraC family transcriptional regulator n=1 Tax=Paenibacillus spongiae TaxID=2909671 RepID=A0ABY5S3S7_9BACL|nr:AraC family transcriptional regulator [Paenibacillus spongiae]UVI28547.1 AraC family transcriptional regulator [Paenibacillus spongiae]